MQRRENFYYLVFFFSFLLGCGDGAPIYPIPPVNTTYTPPITNAQNSGKCVAGAMSVRNSGEYERFLAEASSFPFCQKTGWVHSPYGTTRQVVAGDSACKNWTGPPPVYLRLSLDLKHIQELRVVPRGSGGSNRGRLAPPVLFKNASIEPYNQDKGWHASFVGNAVLNSSAKNISLTSRFGDFSKNENMRIDLNYGSAVIGEITLINPHKSLSEEACSSQRSI